MAVESCRKQPLSARYLRRENHRAVATGEGMKLRGIAHDVGSAGEGWRRRETAKPGVTEHRHNCKDRPSIGEAGEEHGISAGRCPEVTGESHQARALASSTTWPNVAEATSSYIPIGRKRRGAHRRKSPAHLGFMRQQFSAILATSLFVAAANVMPSLISFHHDEQNRDRDIRAMKAVNDAGG